MYRRAAGLWAENVALRYLVSKGYKPLYRNWTCRWGELDLVTRKDGVLVFVEVKYKSGTAFGDPSEAINYYKLRSLRRSVEVFLCKNKLLTHKQRLDVICIQKTSKSARLRHYIGVLTICLFAARIFCIIFI